MRGGQPAAPQAARTSAGAVQLLPSGLVAQAQALARLPPWLPTGFSLHCAAFQGRKKADRPMQPGAPGPGDPGPWGTGPSPGSGHT